MITRYKNSYATWIDAVSPTKDEVKQLMEEFQIDPEIGNDLLTNGVKPKILLHKDYTYLVLHFPTARRGQAKTDVEDSAREVDFVIGKNFLVTVRYGNVEPIELFSKFFEANAILDKAPVKAKHEHAGFVMFHMLTRLYDHAFNELESSHDTLRKMEETIFAGAQKETVRTLLVESRTLTHFKQALETHEEILSSFSMAGASLFGESFSYYTATIIASYQKLYKEIHSQREYIHELRETNDSLLTARQNESMRIFTMLAFFTFPLSLVVGIFSLPSNQVPIIGTPGDFWLILAILLGILLVMVLFFKKKNWM